MPTYKTAADLAAHFSRSRGNKKVPVVMVPTEQLQRIPGMGPGLVRHGNGRVLWGARSRFGLAAYPAAMSAIEPTPERDPDFPGEVEMSLPITSKSCAGVCCARWPRW